MSREKITEGYEERDCAMGQGSDQEFGGRVRETMEQIRLSEQKKREILANVESRMEKKKTWGSRVRRFACAAVLLLLVGGAISIPVRAVWESFIQMRMKSIPEERIKEVLEIIESNPDVIGAANNREFSEEESARMGKLRKAYYREIRLPKEGVPIVEKEADVYPDRLCFVKETVSFYLPERELTDEELLQFIEFPNELNYVVTLTDQYKKRQEEERLMEERLRERLKEEGGISEEDALRIAQDDLHERIGDRADGLEWKVSLTDVKYMVIRRKGSVQYHVHAGLKSGWYFYSYTIDSADGYIIQSVVDPEDE